MQELFYFSLAVQLIAVVLIAIFKREGAKEMNEWLHRI